MADSVDASATVASADIQIRPFTSESELPSMIKLISQDLSEPYSVYTYRHFTSDFPHLSFNAYHGDVMVGTILCKEDERKGVKRGYIAMLVVDKPYRKLKVGRRLAALAIEKMAETCAEVRCKNCRKNKLFCEACKHENVQVVLETEVTNEAALRLYESLGFLRDKRLPAYYMNGNDAYRLKCWLK